MRRSEAQETLGQGERRGGFLLLVVRDDFGELVGENIIIEE
jgi:hypothetical protein